MRSILSMFSKSPFKPLASHMDKVRACVEQIKPLFEALENKDYDSVQKISELIVKLEHEADMIKDDIRTHMRQSMFLPVDKKDFMHLLSAQDDIADAIEDLAVLLRIKNLDTPEEIMARVEKALEHVSADRISLNPDCGFAPGSAADIPIDEAYEKLSNEARAAEMLREKYA